MKAISLFILLFIASFKLNAQDTLKTYDLLWDIGRSELNDFGKRKLDSIYTVLELEEGDSLVITLIESVSSRASRYLGPRRVESVANYFDGKNDQIHCIINSETNIFDSKPSLPREDDPRHFGLKLIFVKL